MRRLFSTFACGWPGLGLLLLRLVAGTADVAHGITGLAAGPPIGTAVADLLAIATGMLLLAGLWTPISGALAVVPAIWNIVVKAGDPWANVLLATIGVALALVGPGKWSVDARLFGWKRIQVQDRET